MDRGGGYNNHKVTVAYKRPGKTKVVLFERDRMEPAATLYAEPDAIYVVSPHHPNEYLTEKRTNEYPWVGFGSAMAGLQAIHLQDISAMRKLETDFPALKKTLGKAFESLHEPWVFGPDTSVDGVPCKTLIARVSSERDNVWVETLIVGVNDHLIRENRTAAERRGARLYESKDTYTNIRANVPIDDAKLAFHPSAGSKEIVKQPYSQRFKPNPLAAKTDEMIKKANTLSFVVEQASSQQGIDGTGRVNTNDNLARLTVELAKPNKAHIKLELKEYSHQNLEIWSDGKKEVIVQQGNTDHYLEKPVHDRMDYFEEIGIPAGACQLGLNLLQMTRIPGVLGTFSGTVGQPTTFEGEPVDTLIEQSRSEDEFGFPASSTSRTVYLFSRRDRVLRAQVQKNDSVISGKTLKSDSNQVLRKLKVDAPIPDSDFEFKPGPGMTPIHEAAKLDQFQEVSANAIDETMMMGDKAPEFKSVLLDGTPVSLSQFKGKVVFLYGWTFGIGNYAWDLPSYEKIYRKFKSKGLVMLGIPYEDADSRKDIVDWLKKHSITSPQVYDAKGKTGGIQHIYKMGGRPFAYLIGRDGFVYAKVDFDPKIDQVIQAALDRKVTQ